MVRVYVLNVYQNPRRIWNPSGENSGVSEVPGVESWDELLESSLDTVSTELSFGSVYSDARSERTRNTHRTKLVFELYLHSSTPLPIGFWKERRFQRETGNDHTLNTRSEER